MAQGSNGSMRVCLVVYSFQEFGGLEDIVVSTAIALSERGYPVSVLCLEQVPPHNQYRQILRAKGIAFAQMPAGLWRFATDWETKEKVLALALRWLSPLVYALGALIGLVQRRPFAQARASARGWFSRQLMERWIGPDRRHTFARLGLSWWRWRWRPDLMHLHGYTSSLIPVLEWASARHIPTVYEEHQTPDAQFDWWKDLSQSINKATYVLAVSDKSAQGLRAICNVRRPLAVISPIVADPLNDGWRGESAHRSAEAGLRVTTIARLGVTKGLDYLLEAIAQVQAVYPATRFRVYGDGPLRQELLAHAARLNLDGKQIFVGAFTRPELPRIMAQTDIFVMSSILEGLPVTIVEAMAYGRAIIATRVGGNDEIIVDGATGLLCAPRDAGCLARHLIALIENPARRASLGAAARQSYESGPYHPRAVCDRLISVYRQTLALGRQSDHGAVVLQP